MPVAISLIRTNSLPKPSVPFLNSRAIQSDPVTPRVADSPIPPPPPRLSPLTLPSGNEAFVAGTDDDLPYLIPLPPDEPQPVAAEESPGLVEPPSAVEPDVTAISYLSHLPFARDPVAQRSATPTPAQISSPASGARSPRNTLPIAAPAARRVSPPQVSCRRRDWLTSAQYWEAHSKLNALVSNTAAGTGATRIEAPVIPPAHVLDSPSPYKIGVPRVCASTSLVQPTTVSGSPTHWDHLGSSVGAPTETPFVAGRTGADLVLAMSTSMPRVIDLGVMSAGGSQWDGGGEWVGAGGSVSVQGEMSISPRASSILRQVAADTAQASHAASSRRRRRAVIEAVLQTPWLDRRGGQDSGTGAPATATRSTGVSPVQTAVRRSAIRRALGPQRDGSAGQPSERWNAPADHVERPPLRITRIFGEPAA
ncbi:hypothetical protein C0993_011930 [Termitomyces sp. T159_Od127]|nr:hypothetical protein C0993_011930 [Termitomyces sp. T159_Od127]